MIDKLIIKQNYLFNLKYIFIYNFLILYFFLSFNENLNAKEVFILDNQSKNITIQGKFIEFLEYCKSKDIINHGVGAFDINTYLLFSLFKFSKTFIAPG